MKHSLKRSLPHQNPVLRFGGLAAPVAIAAALSVAHADDDTNAVPAKVEKPPPLPLHQIEGNGGVFSTLSACLVNPPRTKNVILLLTASWVLEYKVTNRPMHLSPVRPTGPRVLVAFCPSRGVPGVISIGTFRSDIT